MTGRRKTPEEYTREALDDTDPAPEPPDPPDDEPSEATESDRFTALSDGEQADANALFQLLHAEGYETVGGYQLTSEGPDEPTVVTLTAVLPSTNDWPGSGDSDG